MFFSIYKKQVECNCRYDSYPKKLLEIIDKEFPGNSIHNLSLLFVFNQLPRPSDLEIAQKIYNKYKSDISLQVLFNRKFKYERPITFPHTFLRNHKITCKNGSQIIEKNYYMIIYKDKVKYVDSIINLSDLAILIKKNLDPSVKYLDLAVSTQKLKEKISSRLKRGHIRLLNLNSDEAVKLDDFSKISKVIFVHAACSECQLKELFSKLRLQQIIDSHEKHIILFSIFADSSSLIKLIASNNFKVQIYLDIYDEFDLFSVITNDKENPLVIDTKVLK